MKRSSSSSPSSSSKKAKTTLMNEADIQNAQRTWGDAVVHVGKAAADLTEAKNRAETLVKSLYVTDGSLLFCPTKAADIQFRPTVESAVSYFVGGNAEFPEDKGFALEPWTTVRFENTGIQFPSESHAMAMGNYFFGKADGTEVKVEFTFAYAKIDGDVRITLHHSAMPFSR